jgi:hypothetical protein
LSFLQVILAEHPHKRCPVIVLFKRLLAFLLELPLEFRAGGVQGHVDVMSEPYPAPVSVAVLAVGASINVLMVAIKTSCATCDVTVFVILHDALASYHPIITALAAFASSKVAKDLYPGMSFQVSTTML